ncbi:MAG: hypothetical protein SPI12_01660 [Actinomycetaceae bacterium]|nr:hypothetical protein [Actinomycetaceae bacterium]MDY6082554.1 hypothetical protein [Actinomycetaceae bacterium]
MQRVDEEFSLRFIGSAFDNHSIDVRILAPALLAFADVLKSTQEHADPGASTPSIQITATEPGSFIVQLVSTTTFMEGLLDAFTSQPVEGTLNVVGLGTLLVGAVKLIKGAAVHGKHPTRRPTRDGTVIVEWADGTQLIVPRKSVSLAENLEFRKHAQEFAEPLARDGVDEITVESSGDARLSLVKEDIKAFAIPEGDEVVQSESSRRLTVEIVQLTLQGNYRWRFTDGGSTFTALMDDEEFKARITSRSVRFAEGDQLVVQMKERQVKRADGQLKLDKTITKVYEHIPAPVQTVLLFDNDMLPDEDE